MNRRDFLAGSAAAGALAAASCSGDGPEKKTGRRALGPDPASLVFTDSDWHRVRDQFAISRDLIDMSALLIASHPAPVREAIARYRRELDPDPTGYLEANIDDNERRVLAAVVRYLGGCDSAVAITDGTTIGLGLIYNGVNIAPGQEFLKSTQTISRPTRR